MTHFVNRRIGMQAVILASLAVSFAHATDLVYVPINPSFGGNPNNAAMLLNTAQVQNSYKAPTLTAQENFTRALQSAYQSRLLSAITNTQLGGDTIKAGDKFDTPAFSVVIQSIAGNPDALRIVTTDKATGAVATVDVDKITGN